MPAHQVLLLTVYIFETSYSTSVERVWANQNSGISEQALKWLGSLAGFNPKV